MKDKITLSQIRLKRGSGGNRKNRFYVTGIRNKTSRWGKWKEIVNICEDDLPWVCLSGLVGIFRISSEAKELVLNIGKYYNNAWNEHRFSCVDTILIDGVSDAEIEILSSVSGLLGAVLNSQGIRAKRENIYGEIITDVEFIMSLAEVKS